MCSWVRRFPMCATSPPACARQPVTLWNCANWACRSAMSPRAAEEPGVLRRLREIHAEIDTRSVIELYHEAQHHWTEGHALFALGQLGLRQRARLDDLYYAIVNALRARLKPEERSHRQALD